MENNEKQTNPFAENEAGDVKIEENNNESEIKSDEDKKENSNEEKLKLALEDINNKYIRLAADFDNFRKRQMSERESLLKYGAEDTLKKIIPVLDTFSRAKKSMENLEDIGAIKEWYEVFIKQLNDVLDKIGLKKIEVEGKEFDPNTMEAVMQTPTKDYPSHTVISELQAGYQLHDRVLRASMVNVATEGEE